MNDLNRDGIRLITDGDQFSVAPGGSIEINLSLTNDSQVADQVRITAEGIPPIWVSTEQPVLLLQPGEERRPILTIQPPAPPNSHAGRYNVQLSATSTLDPSRSVEASVMLTIAGYEVKGRVGVLLDGLQYSVVPGEQLAIPVVLINQGLGPDTFHLSIEDLPEDWISISTPDLRLEAGEETSAMLVVQPPRHPASRAGRRLFRILITSLQAPDQIISIDCTLTVGAFIEFTSSLEAAQPEQELPARVRVQNQSNSPVTFQVSFNSPEGSLSFEPSAPQRISLPAGEMSELAYAVKPTRRFWVGGEKVTPYTVAVQASGQQTQNLEGTLIQKAVLPVWAVVAGAGVFLLCCLCLILAFFLRGQWAGQPTLAPPDLTTTAPPLLTATASAPLPTATQSQTDQRPLLVGRNWYLVAFNDTRSLPGVQEAYTLFNPDGTLIGYTGCKDLNGTFQTNFNEIAISNINLATGACPDSALQQQEDAMIAILRAARSYFVADTTLQIAGDAGFLNYSLTPMHRPEEVVPPQAVIQVAPQAQAGQAVVFDGSTSTGQVPLVSWRWDFGDGKAASGVIVQHAYRDPGAYTVQLTVTDQRGQSGSSSQQILILPPPTPTAAPTSPPLPTTPPEQATSTSEPPPPQLVPPQANIKGPNSGYLGEPVEFDASASTQGSSPIVSYSWSFGDGSNQPASPQPKVSTIFNRTGDYEVTVTVVDANGLSSNATTRITIDARLDTQVWTLSALNGQPLLPGTAITLQFLQGDLVGFAGCNTYNGRYTATDNGDSTYSVVIGTLSTSRRSCPADIMTQESNYLAAFEQVTSAAIQENMLTLTYPAGTLVFYVVSGQ